MLKKFCVVLIFLLVCCFSATLLGNETAKLYFPGALDSFWVYKDQDGNELTRYAIEAEEIDGKTFEAFSYDPELEDWAAYSPFIHPFLYQINDAGITLVAGDEVENASKARLKKEMDVLVKAMEEEIRVMKEQLPPGVAVPDFDVDVEVEAKAQDLFLLPEGVAPAEEWDVNEIEVNAKMIVRGLNVPENEQMSVDFTIIQTGIVLDTETVETEAGTFEDCLKVEYRTETTAVLIPEPQPDDVNSPGETVTTVWFAPNVGIVKLHQKLGHLFLDMIPEDVGFPVALPPHQERTLELNRYEIKTAESESDTEN